MYSKECCLDCCNALYCANGLDCSDPFCLVHPFHCFYCGGHDEQCSCLSTLCECSGEFHEICTTCLVEKEYIRENEEFDPEGKKFDPLIDTLCSESELESDGDSEYDKCDPLLVPCTCELNIECEYCDFFEENCLE